MSSIRRAFVAVVIGGLSMASRVRAQTVTEFTRRVDSLTRALQVARAIDAASTDSARSLSLPAATVRVGSIVVHVDSQHVALAQEAAERLWPLARRAYGAYATRLERHPFVMRDRDGATAGTTVVSGVLDSARVVRLRSADFANLDGVVNSWKQKIEIVMADEANPAMRAWLASTIPIDPPNAQTWSTARAALILEGTFGARQCVAGDIHRCSQALGLSPVADPAFEIFDGRDRLGLIEHYGYLLRRENAARYDRCMLAKQPAACDSTIRSIPDGAIPLATSPPVRQSLVRFALALGGDSAFDRFVTAKTPREQIEAAARLPADTVVSRWRASLLDATRTSTAIDVETAVSSLFWCALCGALALRSSRWR